MKNKFISLIAILSFITQVIYTAEQLSINHQNGRAQLLKDYNNYLQKQLELYQTQPISLDSLIETGRVITGSTYKSYIRDTTDDKGNTFLHLAVEKQDLPFIQNMFQHFNTMFRNKNNKSPLDLAIEKIHPDFLHNIKTPVYITILETIADRIAAKTYDETDKKQCLKKLIALELACKADPLMTYPFVPRKDLLLKLIPKEDHIHPESFLSSIYQQTADEKTGNTFTHVFVQQANPTALLELVKANRISSSKNNEKLDPLEYALSNFRNFTTNMTPEIEASESFQRTRCCYFILYYYFSKRSLACCDKHKHEV